MENFIDSAPFLATFRAKLRSSFLESEKSAEEVAEEIGLDGPKVLQEHLKGQKEMTVSELRRFARIVGRPVWWFFGEQPGELTIENAETAIANLARARLYLDAVETEFSQVLEAKLKKIENKSQEGLRAATSGSTPGPKVVDFAPYLSRARAILEREAEITEDSEEIFEESVEMIAHSLYSIEVAVPSILGGKRPRVKNSSEG